MPVPRHRRRTGARWLPWSAAGRVQDTELVGRGEIKARSVLMNSGDIPKRSMHVAWDALEMGETYRLLGDSTPLMGATSFELERRLPAGTVIKAEGLGTVVANAPIWYAVSLPDSDGHEGWINSKALLADGVYRISAAEPLQTATTIDYRAEIISQMIDPCLRAIAEIRGQLRKRAK